MNFKYRTNTVPTNKTTTYLMLFSIFSVGFFILVIEIIGTRFIGPFFGTTIFVWSSLITTTLGSLTLGYWLGAKIIKKSYGTEEYFYKALFVAATTSALIPFQARHLALLDPLGFKLAPLIGAILLFAPSLILLAASTTIGIYIFGHKTNKRDEAPGFIFALSTAGSILGALTTVFVFIPLFSISSTIIASAFFISILGTVGLFIVCNKKSGLIFILIIGLFFLADKALNIESNLLFSKQGFYGEVKVKENFLGRCMFVDEIIQGCLDPQNSQEPLKLFSTMIEPLNTVIKNKNPNVLFMGLGAGVSIGLLGVNKDADVSVVEIDPLVVEVATNFFEFNPKKNRVVVSDARTFLRNSNKKYDLIVMDVYRGASLDPFLWSKEMFKTINESLADGGVLSINIPVLDEKKDPLIEDVSATIESVFPFVRGSLALPETRNLIIYASHNPEAKTLGDLQIKNGSVLTDNRNWIEQKYADTAIKIISLSRSFKE